MFNCKTTAEVTHYLCLPQRARSVKEALEQLSGRDPVEGAAEAWQQLSLEQLPVALLLHLKCFQLDREQRTAKIVKPIELTQDLKIDMSEWCWLDRSCSLAFSLVSARRR